LTKPLGVIIVHWYMTEEARIPVDITVYLPDEIGERLKKEMKDNDLKPSRLFRDAIVEEFRRRDAMTEALGDSEVYEVLLQDENGLEYTGRITGKMIAGDQHVALYLTADRRVLAFYPDQMGYDRVDEPGQDLVQNLLRVGLDQDEFADACRALGVKPVIDL
jgi:hypothetical protein